MADRQFGIDLQARVKGGESLSKLANDIREVQKVSGDLSKTRVTYFDALKRDAEAYSSNLKDQIRYIREQIGLDRQRATEGHRERMLGLHEEISGTRGRHRAQIRKGIFAEQRSHGEMTTDSSTAREALSDWMRQNGIGMASESGMMETLAGGFAQGGMMGAGRGFLGRMMGRATSMGGLAMGAGAIGLYGAYKGLQFVGDSHERARELKTMTNPIAMREFGTGDSSSMDRIIDQYQKAGKGASQMADEVMRAAEAYAALTGTSITAGMGIESFAKAGQFAKTMGLDTTLPAKFVGGRYKYTGVKGDVNARFRGTAVSFLGAGEENLHRFPEFLNMVNSITASLGEGMLRQDPDAAINLASQLWSMGAGFQGDRGARFMAQTNQAIRNPRSEAMEAFEMRTARRFLGDGATYGDILLQRQRGLNSPGYMRHRINQWERQFAGTQDQSLIEALGIKEGVYSGVGARAAWMKGDEFGTAFDKKRREDEESTELKIAKVIEEFTKSFGGVESEYDLMVDNAKINIGQATVNITTAVKEAGIGVVGGETSFENLMIAGSGMTSIPGMGAAGALSEIILSFQRFLKEENTGKIYNPDNSLPNADSGRSMGL